MLRVPIHYATPGMELAARLYHPRCPGIVLLQEGVRLEARSVDRLREIGVPDLWIRYPPLDFLRQCCSPEVFGAQGVLSRKVSDVFQTLHADAHAPLEFPAYKSAISRLVKLLIGNARTADYIGEVLDADDALVRHSSNVCFLSLVMGVKLDGYLITQRARLPAGRAKDIGALGLGAMLADIGMLSLPAEVRERWERAGDQTDPEWRRHVVLGFERVRGSVNAAAAAVVLHHHQRLDGSGFPMKQSETGEPVPMQGDDIHVFPRIAAVADEFVRARFGVSPGGPVRTRVRALRHMLSLAARPVFDNAALRTLFGVVPPFPPGSIVTLSDGRTAAVISWSPWDPCRPMVQIVDLSRPVDPYAEAVRIDLAAQDSISIARAEEQDVSMDVFDRTLLRSLGLSPSHRTAG